MFSSYFLHENQYANLYEPFIIGFMGHQSLTENQNESPHNLQGESLEILMIETSCLIQLHILHYPLEMFTQQFSIKFLSNSLVLLTRQFCTIIISYSIMIVNLQLVWLPQDGLKTFRWARQGPPVQATSHLVYHKNWQLGIFKVFFLTENCLFVYIFFTITHL